ncbi:MAG: AAA family ATPase [Cyanobacteria bacterium RI_101]|nr:AAA family ATPase [Cyanobacteria bacterium RI_101]
MDGNLRGLNIFLIGMMGSGKSSVGQVLAGRLGYRFFDADIVLERVAQTSINDFFAREGESAFRDLESRVLGELAAQTRSVVATGGGAVLRRQNWSYLRHGLVVWLSAPVAVLAERLRGDETRPLLKTEDLEGKLKTLLGEREALYQEADLMIETTAALSTEEVAAQILAALPRVLKS